MRVPAFITAGVFLLCITPQGLRADRAVGSIQLSSNPSVIAADGKSVCTITAEVRDRDGRFVPDGTEVHFSASLGVIEEFATTSAGVARIKLVSANITGTSVITAAWAEGQAAAQIKVEFADVPAQVGGPRYISVNADEYLAYSIDYKVLEAIGGVRIRYRALELTAHEAQIDLEKGRLVARGGSVTSPVKLHTADGTVEGEVFSWDLTASEGLLISASTGSVRKVDVSKAAIQVGAEEQLFLPESFDIKDLSDSAMLVRADEADVFPNEKIQFKKANVYIDGKRMFSLPLYVLSLTGFPVEGEQYVGYSTGGITLNLPLYYSLSPSSSGALLIRHGASAGWGLYGQRPGWFLDMRQSYATDRARGSLTLSQVSSGDWGAHFTHSQDLGRQASAYVFLDYPAHRDFFGSVSLNKTFDDFNLGLNLYGTRFQDVGNSLITDLNLQTRSKRLGKSGLNWSLSTRSTYSTGTFTNANTFTQSLHGNLYSKPVTLGQDLSFRGSLGLGYNFGNPSLSGLSTLATAVMNWKPSRYSNLDLSYRFADRASVYAVRTGNQTLSGHFRMSDGKRWSASLFTIKGLDYSSMNVFADVNYLIARDWRVGVRTTLNEFQDISYNDLEFSLGRRLGNRELLAVWSKSQSKVMFELGSFGF